jgi:hypothetical protein
MAVGVLVLAGIAEAGWMGTRLLKMRGTSAASSDGRAVTLTEGDLPSASEASAAMEEPSPPPTFFGFGSSSAMPVRPRGWLAVSATVPVQLFERGRLVGNSWSGGVRLAIGRHELQVVNRTLGIDTVETVDIVRDGTTTLVVERTPGLVTFDTMPGVSVHIDGAAVGRTPIENLEVPSGPHEVVLTRPGFPERRMRIAVTSGKPLRVSADLVK